MSDAKINNLDETDLILNWEASIKSKDEAVRCEALKKPPQGDCVRISKGLVEAFADANFEVCHAAIGSFKKACREVELALAAQPKTLSDSELCIALLACAYSSGNSRLSQLGLSSTRNVRGEGIFRISSMISAHRRILHCMWEAANHPQFLHQAIADINNYAHEFCLACDWLSRSSRALARRESFDKIRIFLNAVVDEWPTDDDVNFRFPDGDIDPQANPYAREWLPLTEWLKLMDSQDDTDRYRAADKPPFAPREIVIARLVNALSDSDDLVRLCAAEALGHFPGSESAQALKFFMMAEPEIHAWSSACFSLGMSGTTRDDAVFLENYAVNNDCNFSTDAKCALACLAVRDFQTWFKEIMLKYDGPERIVAAELVILFIRTWLVELESTLGELKESLQLLRDPYDTKRIKSLFELVNFDPNNDDEPA